MANIPAAITCTDVMAEKHPELVVAFMKGMIKVGRWANEHKRAAAAILDKQTFYRDVEATYEGIKPIDMVPNLSPQNLVSVEIGKDFMLSHKYIKNDFDVQKWAAPEFLEQAAKELLEQQWKKTTTAKLPEATELLASGPADRVVADCEGRRASLPRSQRSSPPHRPGAGSGRQSAWRRSPEGARRYVPDGPAGYPRQRRCRPEIITRTAEEVGS